MLTERHIQLISLALVIATATACFYAGPVSVSLPQEAAGPKAYLYSAQESPVYVLSSGQYRNPQGLFFHALNVFSVKRPAPCDAQVRAFHAAAFSAEHSDSADHASLFALNCMLTV